MIYFLTILPFFAIAVRLIIIYVIVPALITSWSGPPMTRVE
jgi:hypothetical protein